jgi:hypothetical protein
MPGLVTYPQTPNKEAWWRQRKEVYYTAQVMLWEKAVEHSAHLQPSFGVQTWAIGLSRQKNWRQGTQVCIVKQCSHRCVLVDYDLSLRVHIGIPELLSAVRQVDHPKESLLLSQRCYQSFLSVLDSNVVAGWLQKEWLTAKADTKWRRDAMVFSCF